MKTKTSLEAKRAAIVKKWRDKKEFEEQDSDPDSKRVRINLELSAVAGALLLDLQERTGAETRTEVIRNALRVHHMLLSIEECGGEVFIKRNDTAEMVLLKILV